MQKDSPNQSISFLSFLSPKSEFGCRENEANLEERESVRERRIDEENQSGTMTWFYFAPVLRFSPLSLSFSLSKLSLLSLFFEEGEAAQGHRKKERAFSFSALRFPP